ncbi:Regulator of Vps4 activity in the MVB pathway protein [Klebsormidium nitens]|uniref:Regulator of Vps4 activity in the MVB pathway protein n=1 Tax=Klebsormidium nitens TaxID=105231 RepID=A0A1Y1IBV8_KLENI|nr:Regulator of Vps4 activity in the MVB pathway protein [Klebsormidium nitens]|eukprot:GAQ88400.1 Regulator of Vps4 activity in the MVB pathway protein [Klebsormidium nitens]
MGRAEDRGKEKLSSNGEAAREANESANDPQADAAGANIAWVQPVDNCAHLQATDLVTHEQLPRVTSACETCDDESENWACLSCGHVYCGRYVQGHMLQHHGDTQHPVAASFTDLSFWCFPCEQYLNGLTNPRLTPILDAFHQQKFGEHLPDGRLELQLES